MPVKTPKSLDKLVVSKLLERLKDEYDAMYFYTAVANWCQGKGYESAAKFFLKEAENEHDHARKVEKYLTDWNVFFELPAIERPDKEYASLVDVVEQAYDIEYALYEAYEETSKEMFNLDLCVFDFLTPLRLGQNESVIEYSDMLNELDTIGADNSFAIYYWQKEKFA
ncbi:MAG: ferritin-like domain-containing protein [Pseudomonadota bacterium]|jgi:ferritin